MVDANSSMIAC